MTDLGFGITLALKDLFTKNAKKIEQSYKSLDGTIADSSEKINKNMERVQKGAMLVGAGVAALAIPVWDLCVRTGDPDVLNEGSVANKTH